MLPIWKDGIQRINGRDGGSHGSPQSGVWSCMFEDIYPIYTKEPFKTEGG
jgi:hypothetical protein